jgi:hypothetical protein
MENHARYRQDGGLHTTRNVVAGIPVLSTDFQMFLPELWLPTPDFFSLAHWFIEKRRDAGKNHAAHIDYRLWNRGRIAGRDPF